MRVPVIALAGLLAIAWPAATARAADYPARPVRIVIPFSAGGITDIVGRLLAQKMSEDLRARFYVDNRPGAGGNLAAELVAHAPADGYTLLMATTGTHAINPSVYPHIAYDHIKDFAPISLVSSEASALVVQPSLPVHTVPELIALLKAKPNTYNYATAGFGSSTHLAMELFKMMSGTTMTVVAYKGAAEVVQAVMAGQVELAFNGLSTTLEPIREGSLRAIGISSRERSALIPDVATVAETLPGFEAIVWHGLVAPAGTPPDIVEMLSREVQNAVRQPAVAEHMRQIDATPVGNTADEFKRFIVDETRKWAEVVKISGAKLE